MSINPKYYQNTNGDDLITLFENNWMTGEQVRGFLAGNVIKYLTRYDKKNGKEDVDKAWTYIHRICDMDEELGLLDFKAPYQINLSGFTKGKQLTGYLREKAILDMIDYLRNDSNSLEKLQEASVLVDLLSKRLD